MRQELRGDRFDGAEDKLRSGLCKWQRGSAAKAGMQGRSSAAGEPGSMRDGLRPWLIRRGFGF